jgi:integrative and conjugative element protein (TIGR02256 family)
MSQLWLAHTALEVAKSEADSRYPYETGGVILGYWAGENVVVTRFTMPGKDAIHSKMSFVPDYLFDEKVLANVYTLTGGQITYLGDWHTHPNATTDTLSRKDIATLRRIAAYDAARAPKPLMVLLWGTPEDWGVTAWIPAKPRFAFRATVRRFEIQLF